MAEIVNDNKLILILTKHGLSRIADALKDPSVTINITTIRIGSGKNFEYYEPSESQEALEGDLGFKFPVVEKALLEDSLTISFRTVISENIGGIDIREVGLYENFNGEEKLFAISTQQPFVKPELAYNYLMSIDYYMFLKASNIAQVYDQIVLSEENQLATETDLEELMNAMLFAHGNLVNQIGNNSRIVGYNRATQLYDLINDNKESFSYITTYKNYAYLLESVDPENIMSYWVFDHSRHESLANSILDLSLNKDNLSIENLLSTYDKEYLGFMSTIGFPSPTFFYLSSDIPFSLLDNTGTSDSSFSMVFALSPYKQHTNKTLLAKSNYGIGSHVFEVSIKADNSLQIILFSDSENYLTFSTNPETVEEGPVSIIISYDSSSKNMYAYINGSTHLMYKRETGIYNHMNSAPTSLYGFSCRPEHIIYTDSSSTPTILYNEDGTPYVGSSWELVNGVPRYEGSDASYYGSGDVELDVMYAWNYNDGIYDHTAYTKETSITPLTTLYDANYREIPQSDDGFQIVSSASSFIIQYNKHNTIYSQERNIPRLFAWTYSTLTAYTKSKYINESTLLYNSSGVEIEQSEDAFKVTNVDGTYKILYNGNETSYNPPSNIPSNYRYAWIYKEGEKVIWANKPSEPNLLYNSNGSPYTESDWYISSTFKVYYKGTEATYTPQFNIELSILNLTSYIIDENGNMKDMIDSKVGLVSVIKTNLNESTARSLSLILESTMGKNPYVNRRIS